MRRSDVQVCRTRKLDDASLVVVGLSRPEIQLSRHEWVVTERLESADGRIAVVDGPWSGL